MCLSSLNTTISLLSTDISMRLAAFFFMDTLSLFDIVINLTVSQFMQHVRLMQEVVPFTAGALSNVLCWAECVDMQHSCRLKYQKLFHCELHVTISILPILHCLQSILCTQHSGSFLFSCLQVRGCHYS